jgi:LCP family protein required for cell wall assembly
MPTILKKTPESNESDFTNSLLTDLDSKALTKIEPSDNYIQPSNDQLTFEEASATAENNDQFVKPKRRIKFGKIFTLIIISISVVLLSLGGYVAYSISSVGENALGQGENLSLLDQTKQILGTLLNPSKTVELKGQREGRTNFLILGADAAAGLTDTIMIASYYYNEKKIVTVNIPRDTLAFDGFETQKINGVYAAAANRSKDKNIKEVAGVEQLSNILSKEFGIPIHYWAKINFTGVRQVVDELGGVDVDVENSFTDCEYPTDNYSGYIRPCPAFKQGVQKLDGKMALIYARSRHSGQNGEGSDFARGKRQSILTAAILQKIKEKSIFENVSKISSYLNIIGGNFKTNLKIDEIYSLSQILKDVDVKTNFLRIVWATGNGILCAGPNPEVAYTITYCGGAVLGRSQVSTSKQKAKDSIQNILKTAEQTELFDADVSLISNQSTDIFKLQRDFEKVGFNKIKVNNTDKDIKAIKKTAFQNKTLYILDSKVKDLYDKLETKPDIGNTEVVTQLPSDFELPKGYEGSKIVVVIK